jgi:hypothetical protein
MDEPPARINLSSTQATRLCTESGQWQAIVAGGALRRALALT